MAKHGPILDSKELELKDNFEPNKAVEYSILGFMILYFLPVLFLYIKYKDHVLIKYRQPNSVIIGGVLASINGILVPLIRVLKFWCLVNMFLSFVIFSFVIITLSRFIRIFYIQRLSIFKLKFSEKKNEIIHEKGNQVLKKLETLKAKSLSLKGSSSDNSEGFSNDEFTIGNFRIPDPNLYFKRLNIIINKKITLYYVILPILSLTIYYIIITIRDWKSLKTRCINERIKMSIPKLLLNIVVILHSIYMFYQAYHKQKWDMDLRIEYTVFIIVIIFCSVFMSLSMNSVFGDTVFKYRLYIFQLIPMTVHAICIIQPLLKILRHSKKPKSEILTEEDFLNNLNDRNFKEQVKDIATQTFCIENLLFFEAHCDLMNIIISYYNKSPLNQSRDHTFSSSDILHTSRINPILYKPFEPIFTPQFEQLYKLYIKEDGIASININSSTISSIEDKIINNNYSYLMFSKAAEEVGSLLYSNIYPKMKL